MMELGAVSGSSALTGALLAKGLSSGKARLVEDDLAQSVATSTDLGGTVDGAAVRAKLDKQLSADVASGKLTEEDAATIAKVLDEAAQPSDASGDTAGTAEAGGAKGGGRAAGGGGGGGGGGSSEKTELSRTVEITGSIKTTTIKYTDGTSETKTGFANGETSKKDQIAGTDDRTARDWLANIEPGSLVDKLA